MDDEPQFPTFDEPTELRQSYHLPPQEWDRMATLAQHIAQRDAISPLKRRMRTFLTEANRAAIRASPTPEDLTCIYD